MSCRPDTPTFRGCGAFLALKKLANYSVMHQELTTEPDFSSTIPLQDYHIHSNFSYDGQATMVNMCKAAIDAGVREIGFTEHYDLHPGIASLNWFKLDDWATELLYCRKKFAEKLTIRAGIEIGEPHLFKKETQTILSRYQFDYALGSLHWVEGRSLFTEQYFDSRTPDCAYRLYFEEVERLTRSGEFDILSHLGVVARVGYDIYNQYNPSRYEDVIRPVLYNCISRNIVLALNTASMSRRVKMIMPGETVLHWYVEMGGKCISIGSDAHEPERVGKHLDLALAMARSAGIKYLARFDHREAILTPL